jgi:peroxiredoxin/mono/diheme cytochrome c family protein
VIKTWNNFNGLIHRRIVSVSIALACCCLQAAAADQSIENFTLGSHRGVEWSLEDVSDQQLVVVAFLGTECPLAKLYGPRLEELQRQYGDKGVAFIGINANTQDSLAEITAYVSKHKISFPMLKDIGSRVADQFNAERTPDVFLLDKNRNVRYRGQIDDQYLISLSRNKPGRKHLAIAIDELLTGKQVSVFHTDPVGCHIGRPSKVEPHGNVTYSNQIARIFNARCVGCHRKGELAPFTLGSYEDVIGWEETILEVIRTKGRNSMPPWYASTKHDHDGFSNDARLTEEDKVLIETWVKNGMPEGETSQLPNPPQFVDGWNIGEPDQIIEVRDTAYNVPAEGIVDYKYFTVDPGWDEDKYVTATEARPDNVPVVHHIIAYIIPPGEQDDKRKKRGPMLVGYAPGATPRVMDKGTALFVPAGSRLEFEMHYTPNGTPQTDLSYIGVKFADKKNVTRLFRGGAAAARKLNIKPNMITQGVVAPLHRIRRDQMLLDMTPHMHLRGKSFKYEAKLPGASWETLLDVPHYDFNWQLTYELAKPRFLPKDTLLRCTAAFDNTDGNPANPNPNVLIKWGPQSWDEMMIGFFSTRDPYDEEIMKASAGLPDSERTGEK